MPAFASAGPQALPVVFAVWRRIGFRRPQWCRLPETPSDAAPLRKRQQQVAVLRFWFLRPINVGFTTAHYLSIVKG
jgi:hypothetical protein